MNLYVEVDNIDFLDKTLYFICCSQLANYVYFEYWRMVSTGVTVARQLEITLVHHVTVTKMPSTILHQSTTKKTLTTKSSIDAFYMLF